MMYNDMDGTTWGWVLAMMIVMITVATVAVVVLMRTIGRPAAPPTTAPPTPETPEDVLRHRLARGEITIDEFAERRDALEGSRSR